MTWELLTVAADDQTGPRRSVTFAADTAEDAARRYVDLHRDRAVIASRPATGRGTVTTLGRAQIIG